METKEYINVIIKSFIEINFIQKLENILRFKDFENRLTKVKKENILDIFEKLGFEFISNKKGNEFSFLEKVDCYQFKINFNINGGVILPYFYIYINEERIPYEYPNLIFTYKYLKNDFETLMSPGTIYTNYEDFEEITNDFLQIYVDFRTTFLKNSKL